MTLDVIVFRWLNGMAGEFEPFDQVIRLLAGDHLLPAVSVASLIWLWLAGTDHAERRRFQRAALDGLLALGLASLLAALLALMVGRSRPFVDLQGVEMLFYAPTDPSFPSHVVTVLVAIGAAVRWGHKQVGNAVLTAGVVMGVARVVAGVQWPSDVLGAILIGLIVGASAHRLMDMFGPFPEWLTRVLLGARPESPAEEADRRGGQLPAEPSHSA